MSQIALSREEFEGDAQCAVFQCIDVDGVGEFQHIRSRQCSATALANVTQCMVEPFIASSFNASVWATGGKDDAVPEINVRLHTLAVNDSGVQQVYAIHTASDEKEPQGPLCTSAPEFVGSLVIPCGEFNPHVANASWTDPAPGQVVDGWLDQVRENKTKSTANQTISIVIGVCIALVLVLGVIFSWRCRKQRQAAAVKDPRGDGVNYTEASSPSHPAEHVDPDVQFMHCELERAGLLAQRLHYKSIKFDCMLSKGSSRSGEVWVGRYHHHPVVIKERHLQRERQDDEDSTSNDTQLDQQALSVFVSEMALVASFHHPNITAFVGLAWQSCLDVVMITEFAAMGDLRRFLRQENGCDMSWTKDKMRMAVGIAQALEFLHNRAQPIVHGALHPSNVVLTAKLEPQLVDFRVRERSEYEYSVSCWVAPELVISSADVSPAGDIYAFGLLLSELDTCHHPLGNTRARITMSSTKISKKRTTSSVSSGTGSNSTQVSTDGLLLTFTPDCDEAITALASQCTQVDPQLRPSATAVLAGLRQTACRLQEAAS